MMQYVKKAALLVSTIGVGAVLFGYLRGGDLLIDYLAEALRIDVAYRNHCSAGQAFVSRRAVLRGARVDLRDAPVSITSNDIVITFDFSELLSDAAIGLDCVLSLPELSIDREGRQDDVSPFFGMSPDALASILDEIEDATFGQIFCDITMGGDTVRVRRLMFFADEIILFAKGYVKDSGDCDLTVTCMVAPSVLAELPGQVVDMLDEKGQGWKSVTLSIALAHDPFSLRIESDQIRFTVGSNILDDEGEPALEGLKD